MVKVLILAATGQQGNAAARALLSSPDHQHTVRILVRNPSSPAAQALATQGAEVVVGGDWASDPAALDKAFEGGVEAVFFPSIPSFTDAEAEVKGATNVIEAAKRAGTVKHVLYSSVGGIDKYETFKGWDSTPVFANYWISKSKTEDLVRNAGFEHYTLLRPSEFMTNYTGKMALFQVPSLVKEGIYRTPLPSTFRLSEIDVDDIGRVVAAAVRSPSTFAGGRRELDVAGEVLTLGELVAQLGAAAGKDLKLRTLSREEAEEARETNPVVAGHLMMRDSDWPSPAPDDFGLGFRSFRQHLEERGAQVRELYREAP